MDLLESVSDEDIKGFIQEEMNPVFGIEPSARNIKRIRVHLLGKRETILSGKRVRGRGAPHPSVKMHGGNADHSSAGNVKKISKKLRGGEPRARRGAPAA